MTDQTSPRIDRLACPTGGTLRPAHGPFQAHRWDKESRLGPPMGLLLTFYAIPQAHRWDTYNMPWGVGGREDGKGTSRTIRLEATP